MANQENYPSQLGFPIQQREITNYYPPPPPYTEYDPNQSGRDNTAYVEEPGNQNNCRTISHPGSSLDRPGLEEPGIPNCAITPGQGHTYYNNESRNPIVTQPGHHGNPITVGQRTDFQVRYIRESVNQVVIVAQPRRDVTTGVKQPDHCCAAWLVLLLCWCTCCFPFAIASIIYAQKTRNANKRRDYVAAKRHSNKACGFAVLTSTLTSLTIIIFLLVMTAR